MGKIKQLTNIAAATVASVFGIASFAGSASAANQMEMRYDSSAQAVQICKEVTGLQSAYNATYTYTLTFVNPQNLTFVDLSQVTATSATGVSYSSNSADAGTLSLTLDNNSGASTSAQTCATLDFSSAITNTEMPYGEYNVTVQENDGSSQGGPYYYASDRIQDIQFSAYLDVDSNKEPVVKNDKYGVMVKEKATPSFDGTATYTPTHIKLKKQVKGNMSDPTEKFSFNVVITKLAATSQNTINVEYPGSSTAPKSCNFTNSGAVGSTCTISGIKLAHNELASIGLSGTTEQLIPGAYSYTITEVLTSDQKDFGTEAYSGLTTSAQKVNEWHSSSVLERPITKSSLDAGDSYLFVNILEEDNPSGRFFIIFPFVILAIIAGVSVIVLRKTSKKEA